MDHNLNWRRVAEAWQTAAHDYRAQARSTDPECTSYLHAVALHAAALSLERSCEPQPMEDEPVKTLNNSTVKQASDQVADLEVVGDGNMFQLLCKASSASEGWMKSTKAMEIPGVGCVVQVTTQQGDHVAEALTFVPGVMLREDENGGRRLRPAR